MHHLAQPEVVTSTQALLQVKSHGSWNSPFLISQTASTTAQLRASIMVAALDLCTKQWAYTVQSSMARRSVKMWTDMSRQGF